MRRVCCLMAGDMHPEAVRGEREGVFLRLIF